MPKLQYADHRGKGDTPVFLSSDLVRSLSPFRAIPVVPLPRFRAIPESSGHTQVVKDIAFDCDGDTLLVLVDQTGVACHTGRHNCFFTAIRDDRLQIIAPVEIEPAGH